MKRADYNLKVTVRNARLLSLIEEHYGSQAEMARVTGISCTAISALMTFRTLPVTQSGWSEPAEAIATALKVFPSEIWPEHLQDVRIANATTTIDLTHEEAMSLTSEGMETQAENKQIAALLKECLTARELLIVEERSNGASYEDCTPLIGATRERVRQIEARAIRKMRKKAVQLRLMKPPERHQTW